MVHENPDPYVILGVSPTATKAEITHAYRTRLRAHHPDTRRAPSSQSADEDLRQVLTAYALLRDPARRADYDRARAPTDTTFDEAAAPIRVHHSSSRGVQIPVTHQTTNTSTRHAVTPPLRVGPVRWSRWR